MKLNLDQVNILEVQGIVNQMPVSGLQVWKDKKGI